MTSDNYDDLIRRLDDLYITAQLQLQQEAAEAIRIQQVEIERLRAGYSECIDDLQDWGAYVSEYFQLKHDLQGTLDRHKEICSMNTTPSVNSEQEKGHD